MSHHIFFQVQSAALAAMKDEMLELASRLTRVSKERDYMEKALNRLQVIWFNIIHSKIVDVESLVTTAKSNIHYFSWWWPRWKVMVITFHGGDHDEK